MKPAHLTQRPGARCSSHLRVCGGAVIGERHSKAQPHSAQRLDHTASLVLLPSRRVCGSVPISKYCWARTMRTSPIACAILSNGKPRRGCRQLECSLTQPVSISFDGPLIRLRSRVSAALIGSSQSLPIFLPIIRMLAGTARCSATFRISCVEPFPRTL